MHPQSDGQIRESGWIFRFDDALGKRRLKMCAFSKASPNPAISLFAQQTYTLLFAININNISYFRKRSNIDRREIAIFQISRHIYRDAAPVSAPAP
jgi:hypothetical protein